MQIYQISNTFTALACAIVFFIAARAEKDRISRAAMLVWAVAMLIAAVSGPLIAFTNEGATVVAVGRVVTPIGWGALAICAARGYHHRG